MKKIWKRVLALLCAATLIVSGYAIGQAQTVRAEKGQCNYTVFSDANGVNIATGKQIKDAKVVLPDTVRKENLALSIKIKVNNSEDIAILKENVRIELAQAKADENEIQWKGLNVTAGNVNEVLLPFSEYQLYSGYLDLTKTIQWFRIYYSGAKPQGEVLLYEVKLVDTSEAGMKFGETDTYLQLEDTLVKNPETIEASVKTGKEVSEWTVFSAANPGVTYFYSDTSKIVTSEGTTTEGEAPGTGVAYTQYKIPVKAASSNEGRLTFWKKFNLSIPSEYTKEDLVLSFWIHSSSAGKMANGDLELSSNSGYGSKRLYWSIGSKIGTLKAGWNYIELPLSAGTVESGFTTTDIKHMRWNTHKSATLASETTYKFTDMKIKVVAGNSTTSNTVTKTENVDAKALVSNQMIFSNTNVQAETTPYALFMTSEGYPTLLWGTNQYTLDYSVRTGEWVDIAVSRDAEGYINFYIDGVLKGKSSEKETGTLGAFATAHCIGADGLGGQLFDGRIADVRVWEDTRTQQEISDNRITKQDLKEMALQENGLSSETEGLLGSWYLYGDIQYVLENKADISKYDNTAVFRGTRASDWVEYQVPTDIGEDYWTLAFVPDIQNLTESGNGKYDYVETWKAVGQWIADHVESENIQHVISAGDATWGNSDTQYGKARQGFDKYMNLVSWSNNIGNHDYVWDATERDSANYQKYFGEKVIQNSAASATYAGYFEDPAGKTTTENSYYRFSVNGKNWMIMQLELHPRTSVLNWAKEIITKHCNDNVILTTHSYLDGNGNYTQNKNMSYINETTDNASGGYMGDSTENIWIALKECTNIKMILCGHSHNGSGAVVERIETNVNGDSVPALMLNAQDLDAGNGKREEPSYYTDQPLGMLGLLRFSNDGSKVALQWYSPTAEKSFSPLWKGERNSNSLIYTINAKACTHKDATGGGLTMLINEDKATATTNGYTGDSYCAECQKIVSLGKIVEKSGQTEEKSDTIEKENLSNNNQTDANNKSPHTGDFVNPILWFGMMLGAAITTSTLILRRVYKYGKERE